MEWVVASLVVLAAALICVVFALARRVTAAEARQYELNGVVEGLQREIESLAASANAVQLKKHHHESRDSLALIEQLGDAAALYDGSTLKKTADKLGALPGIAADLFEADRKLLAISHLIDQGNSLPQVAARLNLPLGEVELLASIRS